MVEMELLLGIFLFACGVVHADIRSQFIEAEMIPDIYDENTKIPEQILPVSFGKNKITFGGEFSPTYLKDPPIVDMTYDPNSYYLFIFLSPDWLSRSNAMLRNVLMMIVTNIPGNDFSKGETLVEYSGTGPLRNNDVYRYLSALYRQPGKISFDEDYLEGLEYGYRPKWSLKNFLAKYNLTELVAVNMHYSQWDPYVSELQKAFIRFKPKSKQT